MSLVFWRDCNNIQRRTARQAATIQKRVNVEPIAIIRIDESACPLGGEGPACSLGGTVGAGAVDSVGDNGGNEGGWLRLTTTMRTGADVIGISKKAVALSAECRVDDRVSEIFDADDASGLLMLASITTLPARTRIVMR